MNRHRTQSSKGPRGTMTFLSSDGSPPTHERSMDMSTSSEIMDDVVSPGTMAAIKRGEVINQPLHKVKTTIYRSGGGSLYRRNISSGEIHTVTGNGSYTDYVRQTDGNVALLTVPTLNALNTSTQIDAVKSMALAAVDKAPYAVAEDIATIREAYRFFRHPFASLDDLSKRFYRARVGLSNIRKGKKFNRAKALAALWLEYRFALMPSARTICTILDSLNRPIDKRYNKVITAHGMNTLTGANSSASSFGSHRLFRTASAERTVRAVVQYRVSPPLREWQYKYGLRFKDVPELMWDLFPLSFMYDRIWNAGDAIRGLTNFLDPSVSILGGTTSVKLVLEQSISFQAWISSSYATTVVPDVDVYITDTYDRYVWSPSGLDVFPPVLPGGLIKDLKSIADLASLILQRLT